MSELTVPCQCAGGDSRHSPFTQLLRKRRAADRFGVAPDTLSVRFVALTSRRAVEVTATLETLSPSRFTLTATSGISAGTTGVLIVSHDGDEPLGLPAHVHQIEPIEDGWRIVGSFTYLPAETRDALDAFIAEHVTTSADRADLTQPVEITG